MKKYNKKVKPSLQIMKRLLPIPENHPVPSSDEDLNSDLLHFLLGCFIFPFFLLYVFRQPLTPVGSRLQFYSKFFFVIQSFFLFRYLIWIHQFMEIL